MPKQNGFTLIEVMIVVAIIAILAAFALPAYNDYVTRGKIQEATSVLSDMRVKMEQYFMDNRRYDAQPATPAPWTCGASSAVIQAQVRYFAYSCVSATNTYTITADGVAAQGMTGFQYTIDESNQRTSTGPAGWGSPNPNNCWLQKRGGQC